MADLTGKVSIVTGGASGIGAAIARRFAADGAAVCISDLHFDPAKALADELSHQGARAIAVAADVTDETAVAELIDRTVSELGPLDILVSNAGIGERPVPIDERPAEEWTRVIATNLNSVFFGILGFSGAPAYTAAKHGVNGLTKAAALELAPARIREVAIGPAFIRTPLIAGMEDAVLPLHPIGRLGEAEEVANLCAFLASDEASFITGVSYLIDG